MSVQIPMVPSISRPIRVNGYDIDVMGVVSNIVYIRWFEDLRFDFLNQYGSYAQMLTLNQSPVVTKTEIEYLKPVTIHDQPIGVAWLQETTRIQWTARLQIWCGDQLHSQGRQQGYLYDVGRKQICRLPPEFRQLAQPL